MPAVRAGVVPAIALFVSACAPGEVPESPPAEPAEGFQTSDTHYEFRRVGTELELDIPYVFRNATGESVYFVNCNRIIVPTLEKRSGDEWTSVWTGVSPACLSAPVVVEPDGEFTDTIRIISGPDLHPQLNVTEIEGTYRLVWHGVLHDYSSDVAGFGTPLPVEQRTSNEFTLAGPRR